MFRSGGLRVLRKVGIMGGTFNPIHNGHLILAQEALKQFSLDEVLFMPCGKPYMKDDRIVESAQIRAEMTELAIQDNPYFTLSVMEIEQAGNTYTYRTLERLRQENPNTEYYYIIGADSLFHMTSWRYPERIFRNCCVLSAIRNDKSASDLEKQIVLLKHEYDADIRLLRTERIDISSSNIRDKLAAGNSIEGDVPESVRVYIEKKGLYR